MNNSQVYKITALVFFMSNGIHRLKACGYVPAFIIPSSINHIVCLSFCLALPLCFPDYTRGSHQRKKAILSLRLENCDHKKLRKNFLINIKSLSL